MAGVWGEVQVGNQVRMEWEADIKEGPLSFCILSSSTPTPGFQAAAASDPRPRPGWLLGQEEKGAHLASERLLPGVLQ